MPSPQLIFPFVGNFFATIVSIFMAEDLEWILTLIAYAPTYA